MSDARLELANMIERDAEHRAESVIFLIDISLLDSKERLNISLLNINSDNTYIRGICKLVLKGKFIE